MPQATLACALLFAAALLIRGIDKRKGRGGIDRHFRLAPVALPGQQVIQFLEGSISHELVVGNGRSQLTFQIGCGRDLDRGWRRQGSAGVPRRGGQHHYHHGQGAGHRQRDTPIQKRALKQLHQGFPDRIPSSESPT